MNINELTDKYFTGFDTMSDDEKAKAILNISLRALPLKGAIIMPFLHVLMAELLPPATSQVCLKDTTPGLTFLEAIHELSQFLLKNVLESTQTGIGYRTEADAYALKILSPGDKNEIH